MGVVGKTSEEIESRSRFFLRALEIQSAAPSAKGLDIVFHPSMPTILSQVYFALSEAYKKIYLFPGKRTEPAKIAAISCAAVAYCKPLRPVAIQVDDERYLYLNPFLALRVSCAMIDHPFHSRSFDDIRRWGRGLDQCSFPSLGQYIIDASENEGNPVGDWDITLTRNERATLDQLISFFCVLKDMPIYKR